MIVDELAAVAVPSLVKAARNPAIFSNFTFLISSSSDTINGSPLRCGMLTGTISSLNSPAAVAAADLSYDWIANLS